MSLILAEKIGKVYNEGEIATVALRNVDLKIEQGEFVAIMGPSGSGKSTLLNILGFLDLPSEGDYFFEGKSVFEYSSDELAVIRNSRMGFVFQTFNLLPRATVYENVILPLIYSNMEEKKWQQMIKEAVQAVDMEHRINHQPNQLSGGEKQRVAIARALVLNPQVIFADEPTGNLDSRSGENILNILKKLNTKQNRTIILVTHDINASRYARRIIHLKDGSIEKEEYL